MGPLLGPSPKSQVVPSAFRHTDMPVLEHRDAPEPCGKRGAEFEQFRLPGYLGVVALDSDGTVLYVSPALAGALGWSSTHWVGRVCFEMVHPDDVEQAITSFSGTIDRVGYHQPLSLRILTADGGTRTMVLVAENLLGCDKQRVVLSVTDSTAFERAETLAINQTKVLELIVGAGDLPSTLLAIAELAESHVVGTRCAILLASGRRSFEVGAAPSLSPAERRNLEEISTDDDGFLATMAWQGSEALVAPALYTADGLPTTQRIGRILDTSACWSLPIAKRSGETAIGTLDIHHRDAVHPRPDEWSLLRLLARLVAVAIEHENSRAELERRAAVDITTGLLNRNSIEERITDAVGHSDGGAVLFLDIDRLKLVNDSLGHAVGDELIRAVADRLAASSGPDVALGRFGGDEFVMLLNGADQDQAASLANTVAEQLREPVVLGHRSLSVTCSIGVAHLTSESTCASVLRDADLAMYEAKAAGRNTVRTCTAELRARAARHLELEADLRAAVEAGRIQVHFQPVVDVVTGRTVSLEALARWMSGSGPVSPATFIPVAEESGLIIPLGEQVLAEACRTTQELSEHDPALTVAVNLSPIQLRSSPMASVIRDILADCGLRPERLCVEITESVVMSDDRAVTEELDRIRALGVRVAIDDFGTGHSSLAYLRRIPADILKIDRLFVEDSEHPSGRAILDAITTVAADLGLTTVAEGVETRAQYDAVAAAGVECVQGFLISPPRPAETLVGGLGSARVISGADHGDQWSTQSAHSRDLSVTMPGLGS